MTARQLLKLSLGIGLFGLVGSLSACSKEFSCPLSELGDKYKGVCGSVSEVYAGMTPTKKCDPFNQDCDTDQKQKDRLLTMEKTATNQYPILNNCNPYLQNCLASTPSSGATSPLLPGQVAGGAQGGALPGSTMQPRESEGTVRMGEGPIKAPIRIGERIYRMWVPDWQDQQGDLHAASYTYVQVAPSAWWPVETPNPKDLDNGEHVQYPGPPRRLNATQRNMLQMGAFTAPNAPVPGLNMNTMGNGAPNMGIPSPSTSPNSYNLFGNPSSVPTPGR